MARNGDHLGAPFQCDLCIFRRIQQRNPLPDSQSDKLALAYVRRATLDVFWSRASSTVAGNRRTIERNIEGLLALGMEGPYYDPGPSAAVDDQGFEVALSVLVDTRRSGNHSTSHKQWDSSRKVKSCIANFEKTSMNRFGSSLALVDEGGKGGTMRFQSGASASLWYQRFAQGCKARMGQDTRKNTAVSVALWKRLLEVCEQRFSVAQTFDEGAKWTIVGAYLAISYALSLRGNEGFLMEIATLNEYRPIRNGLVWIPLVGRLKGDKENTTHLLRSVPVTGSGINIRLWRDRLLRIHEHQGRVQGPAICDGAGFLLSMTDVNEVMWEALDHILTDQPDLFPQHVTSPEAIREWIQINRTPRRTSESQATRMNVSVDDKEIVNRWSKKERAKGKNPTEPLRLGYTDQALLDDCFRRYTEAM